MKISNWFKPKWKHQNPSVRLNEIKALDLTNTKIFASIVLEDDEIEVRRAALDKLADIDELETLAKQVNDSNLKSEIQKKLENLALRQLKKSQDAQEIARLFRHISKSKSYEDLGKSAQSAQTREKAIAKISSEAILTEIALKETESSLALQAAQKVSKEEYWRKLRKLSKSQQVRQWADAKIGEIEKSKEEAKLKDIATKKKETLEAAVKEFAEKKIHQIGDEIKTVAQAVKNLSKEFPHLDLNALIASITTYEDKFNDEHLKRLKEQEFISELNTAKENVNRWLIESQSSLSLKSLSAEDIERFKNEVNGLIPDSLLDQMKDEYSKLESFVTKAQRQLDFQSNKEMAEAEIRQRQSDIATQMESLSQQVNNPSIERELSALEHQWEKMANKFGDPTSEIIQLYKKSLQSIKEKIQSLTDAEQEDFDERTSKLNGLIDEIKNLGADEPIEKIEETIRQCHHQWKEFAGERKERFLSLWKDFKDACSRFDEALQWKEWYAQKEKERLVEEIQELEKSDLSGQELFNQLRTLQDAWKKAGNIPAEVHHELWNTFKTSNDAIMQRCQEFFEEKKVLREQNLEAKRILCSELKELTTEIENWNEVSDNVRALQERWKEIGPVPKEFNDSIWEEYRSLCDNFFAKRREFLKIEEGHREENLVKKIALCEEAESHSESEDWKRTSKVIRELQEKWKLIGPVPKPQSESIWQRFRQACDQFFDRRRAHYDELDKTRQVNFEQKVAICEELEKIPLDQINDETLQRVEELKNSWKKIGHVKKEDSDAIWDRFCHSIDNITEAQAGNDPQIQEKIQSGIEAKEAIIREAEQLANSNDWSTTSSRLQELQQEWKDIGRVGTRDPILWQKFRGICDDFFARRRDQYEIMEQARLNNLREKMILVEQAEKLAQGEHTDEARREVKMMRQRWKEIGYVPKRKAQEIHDRFNQACNSLFKDPEGDVPHQGDSEEEE